MVNFKSYSTALLLFLSVVLVSPYNLSVLMMLVVMLSFLIVFVWSKVKLNVDIHLFLPFMFYIFVALVGFPFRDESLIEFMVGVAPITIGFCLVMLLRALESKNEYLKYSLIRYFVGISFLFLIMSANLTSDGGGSASIYSNSNHFGSVYACLFFICVLMKLPKKKLFLILLVGVMILDSRAAILGMLSSFMLLLSVGLIRRLNTNFVSLVIAALPALTLVFFYIILQANELLILVINASIAGKNVLSGRFDIFQAVIEGTPRFIGLGYLDPTRKALLLDYSAHNLYLSMYASGGVFGLAAGYLFIFFALKVSYRHSIYALASVAGYLVMEAFQVSLTGNFFKLSLPFWIGIGLATQSRENE